MGNLYSKTKVKEFLKKPWPYWVGGILLGLLNVILLGFTGDPWKVTSGFLLWGAGVLQGFGLDPLKWDYFSYFEADFGHILMNKNLFINPITLLNMGIILGSLTATLLASQFKFKKIKSKKQVLTALIGGVLMGYGSRLAMGCNIGSFFNAIPSFSLHGWIFAVFILLGTGVGIKVLVRFIL